MCHVPILPRRASPEDAIAGWRRLNHKHSTVSSASFGLLSRPHPYRSLFPLNLYSLQAYAAQALNTPQKQNERNERKIVKQIIEIINFL